MSYSIQCVHCQAVLKSPTPVPGGKKIKCPKCKETFTTPDDKYDKTQEIPADLDVPGAGPTTKLETTTALESPALPSEDGYADDDMDAAIAKLQGAQAAGMSPAPAPAPSPAPPPPAAAASPASNDDDEMDAAIAKLEADQAAGQKKAAPVPHPVPKMEIPEGADEEIIEEDVAIEEEEIIEEDVAVEEEEEKPVAKKKPRANEEGEKPRAKKKRRAEEEEEDEKPRAKKKRREDDAEEDEDEPRPKKKRREDDDEEADEKPRAKKKRREDDEDDEEEDEPRSKKKRRDDDDDEEYEDDEPRSKGTKKQKILSGALLWILIGGGVVALLACCGCGIVGYFLVK